VIEWAPLQAYVSALLFSPTGSLVRKLFKAEELDWVVMKPVVEVEGNACLQTLERRGSVYSVTFSPDGTQIASASDGRTVQLWEAASGRYIQELKGHSNSVYSVAFSPNDGAQVASASSDQTVQL